MIGTLGQCYAIFYCERLVGFLARNISSSAFLGEEKDQSLLLVRQSSAPYTFLLWAGIPGPSGCLSPARWRQCSIPHLWSPNLAPKGQDDCKSHIGEGPRKAKRCLKWKTRGAHVVILRPLPSVEHCWNQE